LRRFRDSYTSPLLLKQGFKIVRCPFQFPCSLRQNLEYLLILSVRLATSFAECMCEPSR